MTARSIALGLSLALLSGSAYAAPVCGYDPFHKLVCATGAHTVWRNGHCACQQGDDSGYNGSVGKIPTDGKLPTAAGDNGGEHHGGPDDGDDSSGGGNPSGGTPGGHSGGGGDGTGGGGGDDSGGGPAHGHGHCGGNCGVGLGNGGGDGTGNEGNGHGPKGGPSHTDHPSHTK